jgi:hypothetical protein
MPKNIPSLKPKELIRILEQNMVANFIGKEKEIIGYIFDLDEKKRIVPIDMGAKEFSPVYVLRIFRQFGFTDDEMADLLKLKLKSLPPLPDSPQRDHSRPFRG